MGKLETGDIEIGVLAQRIKEGRLELPEIQRSYVWTSSQVRDFLDSLYRRFPTGALLLWRANELPHSRKLDSQAAQVSNSRSPDFVLDGQQRLTALARVMHDGKPDIRFNIEREEFEVANAAIRRDQNWISVTEVFPKAARRSREDKGDSGICAHS